MLGSSWRKYPVTVEYSRWDSSVEAVGEPASSGDPGASVIMKMIDREIVRKSRSGLDRLSGRPDWVLRWLGSHGCCGTEKPPSTPRTMAMDAIGLHAVQTWAENASWWGKPVSYRIAKCAK